MKNFILSPKSTTPIQQGLVLILFITLLSIGCWVFNQRGTTVWNFIISPMFLFCFYNPIIGAFQEKLFKYLIQSVFTFVFLLLFIYGIGNLVSILSFQQVGELHIIAVLVVVFYILVNLLCFIFRGLLFLLEELDNR